MRPGAVLLGVLMALVGLAGCGPAPPPPRQSDPDAEAQLLQHHRALCQEILQTREQLVAILAGVKDRLSMASALAKVVKLDKTVSDLRRQALLRAPPPAMQQRLQDEFGAQLVDLEQRREREAVRIRALPDGPNFFQAIEQLAKETTP